MARYAKNNTVQGLTGKGQKGTLAPLLQIGNFRDFQLRQTTLFRQSQYCYEYCDCDYEYDEVKDEDKDEDEDKDYFL